MNTSVCGHCKKPCLSCRERRVEKKERRLRERYEEILAGVMQIPSELLDVRAHEAVRQLRELFARKVETPLPKVYDEADEYSEGRKR